MTPLPSKGVYTLSHTRGVLHEPGLVVLKVYRRLHNIIQPPVDP